MAIAPSLFSRLVISRYLQILEFSSWQFSDIYCHITPGLKLDLRSTMSSPRTGILSLIRFSSEQDKDV